jgi:4'-phosphopantetheinyl transferase EntD
MTGHAAGIRALTCLDALFPPGVMTVLSLNGEDAGEPAPAEMSFANGLAPRRQAEFRHGRSCARAALARMGLGSVGIPAGRNREPLWPQGIVGSITHAGAAAAAAVGPASRFDSLGLDLEPATELETDLRARVCRPEELGRLPVPPGLAGRQAKLVFSAKEAAYKALWPLLRSFIEFHELEIQFDVPAGRFAVIPHSSACPAQTAARIEGRFMEISGLFATAVALHHPGAGA